MTTPILELDELAASQSQPHVLVNRTSRRIEAAVNLVVVSRDLNTPPVAPSDGDRYIVGSDPIGDWFGHDNQVAYFSAGWRFLQPIPGWIAYVASEGSYYQYDAGSPVGWVPFAANFTVSNTGSPGADVRNVSQLIFSGAEVQEVSAGIALVEISGGGGGGGGGAGGAPGQVQFNSAGALGGMAGAQSFGGRLKLVDYAILSGIAPPPAPAAADGESFLFGLAMGAMTLPQWRAAAGRPFAAFSGQWSKRERAVRVYSGTTFDIIGVGGLSGTGTQTTTNRTPTGTSLLQQVSRRNGASTAALNATGSVGLNSYADQNSIFVSVSGTSLGGGFLAMVRGGWSSIRSDQRVFLGLATAINPASADPSTFVNCLGVGADEADTTLQWLRNDGSGTAVKVNTGVSKTAAADKLWEIQVYVPPGGGRADLRLVDLDTGTVYSQLNVTTELPAANAGLGPLAWANTGATTSTSVSSSLNGYYAVEDYG
jgi:hypothetical protein